MSDNRNAIDDDTVAHVIFALANAMGYSCIDEIVTKYLAGESVRDRIGSHGVWHFNHMMRTLGREPPMPREAT